MATLRPPLGKPCSPAACAALGDLHIPFSAAWQVFVTCALPRAIRQTAACYGDLAALPPLCRGALVSLVYNRGTDLRGGRRREMRAIKHHIVDGRLDRVAAEFQSMKRLWPDRPRLRRSRDPGADVRAPGCGAGGRTEQERVG